MIVNADDLGMSREVNEATFELMAKGRVSSATILANAPATREAARRSSHFSKCSFGVHLNLTEFEPVTGGNGARLLIDDRGQMSRANERIALHPGHLRAVYEELCAQITHLASLGVGITHLDSHHHVHTRAVFFPVLKAVQRRYRIRKVRLTKNFYSPDQPCRTDLLLKKRAYNRALQLIYTTHTTDAFSEFLTYHQADPVQKRSVGQIELMVHPGAASAAHETAVLESDWVAESGLAAELISYADLSTSRGIRAPRSLMSGDVLPCD